MIHATFPFTGTAPATTSFVSGFRAVPLAASPKLWQIADPTNIPTTVTAESDEPCLQGSADEADIHLQELLQIPQCTFPGYSTNVPNVR